MKTSAQRAAETRRAYAFEDECVRSSYLLKRRTLKHLRSIATRLWKAEGRTDAIPIIEFGIGALQAGRRLSFCIGIKGQCRIVLAKPERNILTLLHELVHALGHEYTFHDVRFVSKAIAFYVRHGRCKEVELVLGANTLGIRVKMLS